MSGSKCTVIIPTKNAMPGLAKVLEAVLMQKTAWPFEVIIIDSGSSDGTRSYIQNFSNIRLIEIDPKTFGHGRTRNQAIAAANSEFVALLTHDAKPYDENWLANLVATAEQNPEIAGVFGRHVANNNASPFTKADLDKHFEGFLAHPLIVDRNTDPQKYESDIRWRQFLHFYSDNNSLMRKSIWEKHPYPDVEFAEDQIWARDIIELGYKKAYAPDAVVYHSHDYNPSEQLRRAFDESRNFKKYFGYELSGSLVPTLALMAKLFIQAFIQKIDSSKFGKVTFPQRFQRGRQRASLAAGHYLGANQKSLPRRVSAFLSLDEMLFRS